MSFEIEEIGKEVTNTAKPDKLNKITLSILGLTMQLLSFVTIELANQLRLLDLFVQLTKCALVFSLVSKTNFGRSLRLW